MPAKRPHSQPRTQSGARLVEVAERDPVAERDAALAAVYADYNEIAEAAFADYIAEVRAAAGRWKTRLDGATAEYQSHVERIRADD